MAVGDLRIAWWNLENLRDTDDTDDDPISADSPGVTNGASR